MAADYYTADAENGDHIDDPSEDALLLLIEDLNRTDNTFVTITPSDDDATWYASVSLLDNETYEVERRDPDHGEHELGPETYPAHIAKDLTIWLAGRTQPG